MLRSSPLARRPFSAHRPVADTAECIASAKVEKPRNHVRSPYRAALQFRRRLALAVAEMRHAEPANASFRVSLVLRIILGAMDNEDRQILIDNCEVMKQLLQCQLDQDRAWRTLSEVLEKHIPTLASDYKKARKDALLESASTTAIRKLQSQIDEITERLKRPPAN
jgi:hypothetical protein